MDCINSISEVTYQDDTKWGYQFLKQHSENSFLEMKNKDEKWRAAMVRDGSGREVRSNSSQNSSDLVYFYSDGDCFLSMMNPSVSALESRLLFWTPTLLSSLDLHITIFWLVGLLSFLRQGFRAIALAGYINKSSLQITEPCTHTVSGVLVKTMCLYTRPWSMILRDTRALFMSPTNISVYTLLVTRLSS